MPFHTVKSKRAKGKFDVANADTGEVKNAEPYDSEAEAQKYSNALNAHSDDNNAQKMVISDHFEKFVQLEKVDQAKGQVWGILSNETPDRAGEIIDYEHSKPHFVKWSAEMQKDSKGKSLGNLRAMHGGNLSAAGKLIYFEARDATKDFYIGAQVIDPVDLEKVYTGVYTGFSVGGGYGPWRKVDGPYIRREGIPVEATLCDKACNPDSVFQFVKLDGTTEMRKFATVTKDGEPMADETKPEAPATEPEKKPEAFDEILAKADQPTLKAYLEKLQKAIQPDELQKTEAAPAADGAKDDGGAAKEPEAANDGKPVVPSDDDLRAKILGILEELGLVVKEGEAMKAVMPIDMQKSAEALDLVKADFAKKQDELSKVISDGDKALAKDIAQLVVEVEKIDDLSKRVERVTGMGPVVMVPSADPTQQSIDHDIEVLKKYQASANNPAEVAKFGELIAAAEIRKVQNTKKE
jgi:hypothetical protein